ncbi:MAG TPA: hypothetical protein VFS08_02810 [Gemmatimonadaceae bacterium]|nr:hypothetical protein [Gemmatimonadaceae bacterium]
MRRAIVVLGVTTAATTGTACGAFGPDGPREERRPAYVRYFEERSAVEAPDTVSAGAPFVVTVHTFGGGCIAKGDTEAEVQGSVVTVRPYDVVTTQLPANHACTSEERHFAHEVTVRVTEPGAAVVRVVGRVAPGDSAATIERRIVVR